MGYTDVAATRTLTGISATSVSDEDVAQFIAHADARIDRLIGPFSPPYPALIRRLSTLLAAVDMVRRIPDWKQREGELAAWRREADEIFELYGGTVKFEKT